MQNTETILIVEDEPALLRGLKDNFALEGYRVETAVDGEQAYESALTCKPDLIVLDIMIPKINGYEVCRLLRKEGLETPIIMLTAKGQKSDIVLGLNLGADDYITKPFSIRELLARVNAFLRRRRQEGGSNISFGEFEMKLDSRQLLQNEKEVELSPKEFSLLEFFAKRPGRALTRVEILRSVWGYDILVTARSVDRCVATLRNKIQSNPRNPQFIKTIREIGYRFESGD